MKKHYIILLIICVSTLIALFMEDTFKPNYYLRAYFHETVPSNHEQIDKRLEIDFYFAPQPVLGSNQLAVWVEDENGNLVKTLAVTQYTSTGGWRLRKTSLQRWVNSAKPHNMVTEEIDAISSATPKHEGNYTVTWDFTDQNGESVPEGNYTCFLEGTLYFSNHVIYQSNVGNHTSKTVLKAEASYQGSDSTYKDMLRDVVITYYPGKGSDNE